MRRMTTDAGQALVRSHVVDGPLAIARRAELGLQFGVGATFDVNAPSLLALDARCVREMLRQGCSSAPLAARALYRVRYERGEPADALLPSWRRALDRLLALVGGVDDVPRVGVSLRAQIKSQIDDYAIVAQHDADREGAAPVADQAERHLEAERLLPLRACA